MPDTKIENEQKHAILPDVDKKELAQSHTHEHQGTLDREDIEKMRVANNPLAIERTLTDTHIPEQEREALKEAIKGKIS